MKVWFCRDKNGDCSVWDAQFAQPILRDVWGWCADHNTKTLLITVGNDDTFEKYGEEFHGVRKGHCKLLDLNTV